MRRKLLLSVLVFLVLIVVSEGLARVFVAPDTDPLHQRHEEVIRIVGLPALNDAMEVDPDLFWRLKRELTDLRVTGEVGGELPMDFTVNTRGNLRNRELGEKRAPRVLALGDSCTFGVGVDDTETWPARLEALLRAGGRDVEVINAGVPGYTVYQGERFLELRGFELDPDVVVATFGFNDNDSWGALGDLENAKAVARRQRARFLSKSRLILGLTRLVRREPEGEGGGEQRPRLTPDEFGNTLLELAALCRERNVDLVLMVWPYRDQVTRGMREHIYYQGINVQVCEGLGLPVVDLVAAFLDAGEENLFVDHVHASARGCELTAQAVAESVGPLLE